MVRFPFSLVKKVAIVESFKKKSSAAHLASLVNFTFIPSVFNLARYVLPSWWLFIFAVFKIVERLFQMSLYESFMMIGHNKFVEAIFQSHLKLSCCQRQNISAFIFTMRCVHLENCRVFSVKNLAAAAFYCYLWLAVVLMLSSNVALVVDHQLAQTDWTAEF